MEHGACGFVITSVQLAIVVLCLCRLPSSRRQPHWRSTRRSSLSRLLHGDGLCRRCRSRPGWLRRRSRLLGSSSWRCRHGCSRWVQLGQQALRRHKSQSCAIQLQPLGSGCLLLDSLQAQGTGVSLWADRLQYLRLGGPGAALLPRMMLASQSRSANPGCMLQGSLRARGLGPCRLAPVNWLCRWGLHRPGAALRPCILPGKWPAQQSQTCGTCPVTCLGSVAHLTRLA